MREELANIWDKHPANWVCVTTNGVCRKDGTAVMGAGIAKQAANRFPDLPAKLGGYLRQYGNRLFVFREYKLVSFPTKHDWKSQSDLNLIGESCRQLVAAIDKFGIKEIYLPRPGCRNGGLAWGDVRLAIEPLLDDRVVVCDTSRDCPGCPYHLNERECLSCFRSRPGNPWTLLCSCGIRTSFLPGEDPTTSTGCCVGCGTQDYVILDEHGDKVG